MSKRKNFNWLPDELLLAAELVFRNNFRGLDDKDSRVQELSRLLRSSNFFNKDAVSDKHRSPSSVALKTANIASTHPEWKNSPTNSGRLDSPALEKFLIDPEAALREAQKIRQSILRGESALGDVAFDLDMEDIQADEGRLLKSIHIKRERDPRLREAKIRQTRLQGLDLACEICGFDFLKTYGDRGKGYIEVHHVLPLHASGPVKSKLDDLALLCSNCHRMIHRRGWLTPRELKDIVDEVRILTAQNN